MTATLTCISTWSSSAAFSSQGRRIDCSSINAIILSRRSFNFQRDPKGDAKKNAPHLRSGDDIFSQLAPILRSAGTSEVRLVLNAVWTRARPCAAH